MAKADIIAHWDDDDWYAPHRLSYQLEVLETTNADVALSTSSSSMLGEQQGLAVQLLEQSTLLTRKLEQVRQEGLRYVDAAVKVDHKHPPNGGVIAAS